MSQFRSLVSCLVACVVVACGGDEDTSFSSIDAAVEAGGGQAGTSGQGGGSDGSGGSSAGSAGEAGNAGDGGTAGAPNDGGAMDSSDSDVSDAETADGSGGAESDAGSDAADGGPDGCARPTVYYADKDKDGHGSMSTLVVACSPPATGTWVLKATDCNDNDSRVHPGQAAYFAVAYLAPSGNSSFDYDCSTSEDEDPAQAKAPANCGLLSLALCAGSGYTETPRTGQGLSPYCGSSELRVCRAALGILLCENVSEVANEPFRCK